MEATSHSELPQQLEVAKKTSISDLSPDLQELPTRAVRGVVTITWPYNSVKNSFAFILAEPDFRLRRNKGQVRVNFTGPAAKIVGECGLGGNDEICLSLDGADWVPEETKKRQSLPGAGIDWQLKFSHKLTLQAKLGETSEVKVITIDRPVCPVSAEPTNPIAIEEETPFVPSSSPRISRSPSPSPSLPAHSSFTPIKDPRITKLNDEYASPAFIKRARLSYGSLFEDGYDIFEDDGGVKGKGRKRIRFGRKSGAWKFSSHSPSPEPPAVSQSESDDNVEEEADGMEENIASSPPKPTMADEGCQTMELDIPAPNPASPSDNTGLQHPGGLSPAVDMVPHSQNGLVNRGVQALAKDESTSPSAVPVTTQTFAPLGASQFTTTDIPPFGTTPGLSLAGNPFTPGWEPKHFGDTALPNAEDPVGHGQSAGNPFMTGNLQADLSNNQLPNLEETGPMDFMYPSGERTGFGRNLGENSYNVTQDVGQNHFPPAAPHTAFQSLDAVRNEEMRETTSDMLDSYPTAYLEDPHLGQLVGAQSHSFRDGIQSHATPMTAETRPWAAVNAESATARTSQTSRLGSADGGSPDAPVLIDDDESETEVAPPPTAVEDTLMDGRADALGQYDDAEVDDEADAKYSDDDEPEYEEDEMGGDYDTRNYTGPDDDDDDSHDEDLRPHELEEQFDDVEDWDEEDELEEESYYESDDEEDEDLDEDEIDVKGPEKPATSIPNAAPMVIDLISSSEDEDEEEDQNKGAQIAQPQPAGFNIGPKESLSVKEEEPLDDGFVSQEENDDGSERLTTSDASEALDEEDLVEDEEAETAEEIGSVVDGQPSHAQSNDASGASEEDERNDRIPVSATSAATDDRLLVESYLETKSTFEDGKAVTDRHEQEQDVAPLTAAEGLELLSQSVKQQQSYGESGEATHIVSKVDVSQIPIPIPGDSTEAVESHDVEMAGDEVAGHVEPTDHDVAGDPEVADVEMVEAEAITHDNRSALIREHVEAVDLQNHPRRSPADESGAPEESALARSSSTPLSPSRVLHFKAEAVAVDQLPTPLNTQLTTATDRQETPSIAVSPDEARPHDNAQASKVEQAPVRQVTSVVEQLTEQDQVAAVEIVEERIEQHDHGQISTQHQPLVVDDHIEEPMQASQSPSPAPSEAFQSQLDDDAIQTSLLEVSQTIESNEVAKTSTADISADSSFRSQMQSDEELQASILENNSHELDEGQETSFEAVPASSQPTEDEPQTQDEQEAPANNTVYKGTRGYTSPILGSDPTKDTERISTQTPGLTDVHRKSQVSVESDQESSDAESQEDASVQLARAANAATKRAATRKDTATSPQVKRPSTRSQDAQRQETPEQDNSSVQLSRASMSTPSKAEEDGKSLVEAKLQLARHLRDELPDCTQLQVLRHHTGQSLDVVAVAMMQPPNPQRAKKGPREYMMSFTITDQSTAPSQVVEVQLYRPHKDALPIVKPGDVVLLRKFRVVSLQGKGFGLRTEDTSSWAVWEDDLPGGADGEGEGEADVDAASIHDGLGPPQIRGPPVEAVEKEARHAAYLRAWFRLLDAAAKDKLERANKKIIAAGKGKGKGK